MILEREISTAEILDWVQAEAQARQVEVTLFRSDVEERTEQYFRADGTEQSNTFVLVRIHIDNVPDLGEEIKFIVDIQETWNNRTPRPERLLHLIQFGVPQGVY